MPSYKVISKGFHGGAMYDPDGKRNKVHTTEPFPKKGGKEIVPAWLQKIETETAAQASARKGAETKAANAALKKAKEDEKLVAEASFMGAGESATTVETL